jgi:putative transposase
VKIVARLPRVVAVDVPHHITQRGNNHEYILNTDADRLIYLDLLQENALLHHLLVVGYCLMSNHVHLIGIPRHSTSLARALKVAHGRYAAQWNVRHHHSGHVWQGRPYSCPLDPPHVWQALRYAELNPVRAGMVADAVSYPWSSAAAHCGQGKPHPMLDSELWRQRWSAESWHEYLHRGETGEEIDALRRCTFSGRPLGTVEFVEHIEETLQRSLVPKKGGRPQKAALAGAQESLNFETFDQA